VKRPGQNKPKRPGQKKTENKCSRLFYFILPVPIVYSCSPAELLSFRTKANIQLLTNKEIHPKN